MWQMYFFVSTLFFYFFPVCATKKSMPTYFCRGQCLALWSKQEKLVEVLVELPGKQSYFHCKNMFIGQRHCMNTANIFTVKINKSALVFMINYFHKFPPLTSPSPHVKCFLYGLSLVIISVSFLLLSVMKVFFLLYIFGS